MAQLPPKVPTMTQNWADFPHQRMSSLENLPPPTAQNHLSWIDEFHDFSTAKRGSHRRSISDSIAFIEPPMVEECRRSSALMGSRAGGGHHNMEFDRFDDEQLMSMFADEIAVGPAMSLSNASSPSDHNSNNDDQQVAPVLDQHGQLQVKSEADEVQSSCKSEAQGTENSNEKINIDPKRVKRILANRQSAQRSRVRKLQYISELERSVTSLQAEVSVLSPRVAFLDHQRLILNVDNSAIKQRIAALAQDKIFKDAHQEALRREIERLRKVYQQQNLKAAENGAPPPSKLQPSSPRDANNGCMENEQLPN